MLQSIKQLRREVKEYGILRRPLRERLDPQGVRRDYGAAEANEVLYLLQGEQPSLGIWFDFEAPECLDAFDPTGICSAFIVACNEKGYAAGIYASLSTLTDILDLKLLADYVPIWCSQFNYECNFKDYYPDKILAGWQYSDSQYIGDTNVDMNEWYGEDW